MPSPVARTPHDELGHLSEEDRQLLRLLAKGLSAKQAARELAVTARKVERRIEIIRTKTASRNCTHMVAQAVLHSWI